MFSALPGYFGRDLTVILQGRDTARDEPLFNQQVFINGEERLINSYPTEQFGRVTADTTFTFHFRIVR